MTAPLPPLQFSDDELDDLLLGLPMDVPQPASTAGEVEPTEELRLVARRIAGQYAEILVNFAGSMFGGQATRDGLNQVNGALASLTRLAQAAEDQHQHNLLVQLQQQVTAFGEDWSRGVGRQRFLHWLRQWLLAFADCLEGEDARRVRGLVEYEQAAIPLFQDLANIRGIAEKRLQRLYCAGLFTVDAIGEADPGELATLTGIPRPLAVEVVQRTRVFAIERQRRCVMEMRARARELAQQLDLAGDLNPELLSIAQDTLRELSGVLSRVNAENQP